MKKVRSRFSKEQLYLLTEIGIELSDETDYDDDSLVDFHDKICEKYLSQGFDGNDNPTSECKIWESIIDLFYDEFEI